MPFHILYFINGLTQLVIAIFGLMILYLSISKKRCKIGYYVGSIGITFLILSLLNFSWAFNSLEPSFSDFMILNSFFISIITALFISITYHITENKNLIFLLFIYLLSLVVLFIVFHNFMLISFISMLLLLILFLNLEFFSHQNLEKAGLLGTFYSIIYLFLLFMFFFGKDLQLSFIPDVFMIFVFYNFMQHSKLCNKTIKQRISTTPTIIQIFKFILFITALTSFIMLGTLAIHEIGHALFAKSYGCEYSFVVYQSNNFPNTEIKCDNNPNENKVLIGAISLTSLLALIFFLTGTHFIKSTSYLIFAFGIIIANKDFTSLGISNNIVFVLNVISIIVIVYALLRIITPYAEDYRNQTSVFCKNNCKVEN